MKLPKELSPDPLLISTVELRFNSQIDPSTLLSLVYPVFAQELPNLKPGRVISGEMQDIAYSPEHILSNSQYSLSFGKNVIAFETVGKYPLWDNYFDFISRNLKKFLELGIVENIHRIGVRYASLFENMFDLREAIKNLPLFNIPGYAEVPALFRTNFIKGNYTLHLQILPRAEVLKSGNTLVGMVIDVDASFTGILQPNNEAMRIIDELHTEEKTLFFEILKDSFIKGLNPIY